MAAIEDALAAFPGDGLFAILDKAGVTPDDRDAAIEDALIELVEEEAAKKARPVPEPAPPLAPPAPPTPRRIPLVKTPRRRREGKK